MARLEGNADRMGWQSPTDGDAICHASTRGAVLMTCAYSFAPHGRTGNTTVFCATCQLIVAIVPNAGEARILVEQYKQDPAPCRMEDDQ